MNIIEYQSFAIATTEYREDFEVMRESTAELMSINVCANWRSIEEDARIMTGIPKPVSYATFGAPRGFGGYYLPQLKFFLED